MSFPHLPSSHASFDSVCANNNRKNRIWYTEFLKTWTCHNNVEPWLSRFFPIPPLLLKESWCFVAIRRVLPLTIKIDLYVEPPQKESTVVCPPILFHKLISFLWSEIWSIYEAYHNSLVCLFYPPSLRESPFLRFSELVGRFLINYLSLIFWSV